MVFASVSGKDTFSKYGHMWPDGIALEHHSHFAVFGIGEKSIGYAGLKFFHREDMPILRLLQAGDAAEQGGLAAPAWTQQHEELSRADGKIQPAQRRNLATRHYVRFGKTPECQASCFSEKGVR